MKKLKSKKAENIEPATIKVEMSPARHLLLQRVGEYEIDLVGSPGITLNVSQEITTIQDEDGSATVEGIIRFKCEGMPPNDQEALRLWVASGHCPAQADWNHELAKAKAWITGLAARLATDKQPS